MTRSQIILQVVENLGMGSVNASHHCPKCKKKLKESYFSNQKLGICPHCQAKLPEGSGYGTVAMGSKSPVPALTQGVT